MRRVRIHDEGYVESKKGTLWKFVVIDRNNDYNDLVLHISRFNGGDEIVIREFDNEKLIDIVEYNINKYE